MGNTRADCTVYRDIPALQRRLGHTVQHLLREKEINLCHITTPFFTVRLRTAGNGRAEFFFCARKKDISYINIEQLVRYNVTIVETES